MQTSLNYSIYADGVFAMAPQSQQNILTALNLADISSMTSNHFWLGEYSYDQIRASLDKQALTDWQASLEIKWTNLTSISYWSCAFSNLTIGSTTNTPTV